VQILFLNKVDTLSDFGSRQPSAFDLRRLWPMRNITNLAGLVGGTPITQMERPCSISF